MTRFNVQERLIMPDQALQKFISDVREQIQFGEIQKSLEQLDTFVSTKSGSLKNEIILYSSRLNQLRKDERRGTRTAEEIRVDYLRLVDSILIFLDILPNHIKPQESPTPAVVLVSAEFPELNSITIHQRIIGINNLKQISWIQKGVEVSKCVCRILTPNGYGTGFLIAEKRIMTNNHVIPSPEIASKSFAEFNYQQDINGRYLPTFRLPLLPSDFHTSPQEELDYTIVGFSDDTVDASLTLGTREFLDLNPNSNPLPSEHVIIIQHPNGGLKQIALTGNQVINSKAQHLFYSTDTMPGSSGSPVFNDLWQVIAIHHAYGGIVKGTGDTNHYANEGILLSAIRPHAADFWPK